MKEPCEINAAQRGDYQKSRKFYNYCEIRPIDIKQKLHIPIKMLIFGVLYLNLFFYEKKIF